MPLPPQLAIPILLPSFLSLLRFFPFNLLCKSSGDGLLQPECLLYEGRDFCLFRSLPRLLLAYGFMPGMRSALHECLCMCTHIHTHSCVQSPLSCGEGGRERLGPGAPGKPDLSPLARLSVSSLLCPAVLQRAHWGAVCALLHVPEPCALL